MLEYDFLKIINDHVKIFRSFPLPAVICDLEFTVYWSNTLAKNLYPSVTDTASLTEVLAEYSPEILLERLNQDGSCTITDVLPLSGVNLSITPVLSEGVTVGMILLLMNADTPPTPLTAYVTSKTAMALSSSIRDCVDGIFGSMDSTALKADFMESGWVKSSLNRIGMDSYRILRIVDNISEYARLQSGAADLRFTVHDLGDRLRDVEEAIVVIAREMGIPVEFRITEEPCSVSIDRTRMELAFYNVLHNSLYFTRPGNRVTVTLKKNTDSIVYTIEDQGVGISKEHLGQIWRPYTAFGSQGRAPGIGLGLTLAKAVILAHGGDIGIQSTPDLGTSVTVKLKLANPSDRLVLGQNLFPSRANNRFSTMYTGLTDAASSPYRTSFPPDDSIM